MPILAGQGKRVSELETLVAERIAYKTGREVWDVFILLDDALQKLTGDAEKRLAWQAEASARLKLPLKRRSENNAASSKSMNAKAKQRLS